MTPTEYPSNLGNPFTLGVASGDPLPDGFVLWTRLAPDPLNGGGMDDQEDVAVDWEVAADADFTNVVQSSRQHLRAIAEARLAHSVHLEVTGLEPGTHYYYRFTVGDPPRRDSWETGHEGRTKTAPETTAEVPAMVFAFANCQSWQGGLYPTYRHMARDDELDLVVHLGDTSTRAGRRPVGQGRTKRLHRRTSRATATGTPNTRPTRIYRPRMRRTPGWSPGTTTRSKTTTPAPTPGTTSRTSPSFGPPPIRPTTSTCP